MTTEAQLQMLADFRFTATSKALAKACRSCDVLPKGFSKLFITAQGGEELGLLLAWSMGCIHCLARDKAEWLATLVLIISRICRWTLVWHPTLIN
jgi:hypothetical protein